MLTGALNLSVRVDTLTSFPVGDQSVTRGECEGPKAPYRQLLFSLVAWQQKGANIAPEFPILGGGVYETGALCWFYVLSFYNRPNALLSRPFCLVPNPMFSSPREEVSEVLSFQEPKRLWLLLPQTWPFIGPTRLKQTYDWSINTSRDFR